MTPGLALAIDAAQWLILAYFAALNLVYISLNFVALRVIGRDSDARTVAALPDYTVGLEPAISVVVPAYNEERTIVASVRSMLQLDYPEFEIVVVNDGSRDATLQVLEREFGMRRFPEAYRVALPVKPVRGIYRSVAYPNLRVVDKVNGGRSDAMNAGINAARHPLFCAVDADSVLQRDSLRRIVRPFMEDRRVIASGGTIRIANGCRISRGFLESVGMPDNWLARVQIVEYLRAFLYGRLGWSPINAVLIISGAFGLFRRQTVIEAGGYSTATIGEDMDLTMRLHRRERDARRDYRIVFVPDPICWTEAPETLAVLRLAARALAARLARMPVGQSRPGAVAPRRCCRLAGLPGVRAVRGDRSGGRGARLRLHGGGLRLRLHFRRAVRRLPAAGHRHGADAFGKRAAARGDDVPALSAAHAPVHAGRRLGHREHRLPATAHLVAAGRHRQVAAAAPPGVGRNAAQGVMRHPVSTCISRAAAPGRPKQGPALSEGRSPYSASGVLS